MKEGQFLFLKEVNPLVHRLGNLEMDFVPLPLVLILSCVFSIFGG